VIASATRFDEAGDEGRLHLADRIVDREAGTFVQDLDAEDLHRGGGTHFVGTRERDVEGQDLVGIPGLGQLLHTRNAGHRGGAVLIDGGADLGTVVAGQAALEDGVLGEEGVLIGLELGRPAW